VFHVPGYKVGVGSAPGYNNIEAMDRGYYSGCLQSPIEEMEACLDDGLGLDGVTNGVELDLEGLMRMDTKTQMEALKIGVDAGIIAPNEGRKQVNLPPLEGGDTVYMQQQDFPLDQVRQNKIVQSESPPASSDIASASDDEDDSKSLGELEWFDLQVFDRAFDKSYGIGAAHG
jgi:phage portal protein BeeE